MSDLRGELRKCWEELADDTSQSDSEAYAKIRLQTPLKCDFFAAMDTMDKRRILRINLPSVHIKPNHKYPDIAGLEIRPRHDKGITTILLKVIDEKYNELFENLCIDLIAEASVADNGKKCIDRFFYKLTVWKDFFRQFAVKKFDEYEAQGLFGELYFLYKVATAHISLPDGITYWEGPSRSEYDFRYGFGAVEVKTLKTTSRAITISNLNQLDSEKCGNLFLVHLSVEIFRGTEAKGLSLPGIVAMIRKELEGQSGLLDFDRNLVAAGYLENSYPDLHFDVRAMYCYEVKDDFPRLIPANVPAGIKSAKYSIDTETCSRFSVDEKKMFATVMGPGNAY